MKAAQLSPSGNKTPAALKALGITVIAFGLVVASTGIRWQEPVTAYLTAPKWSADLVLWLPYWPFEPFLSIFIIGLGTWVATRTPANANLPGTSKIANIS